MNKSRMQPRENKVMRIISVLQYANIYCTIAFSKPFHINCWSITEWHLSGP